MSEDIKTNKQNLSGDPPTEESSKKKKADIVYRIYKKESHKDNRCILVGIKEDQLLGFNKGEIITVSNEQIKIIGCKVDAEGNIISIPYRWLGVKEDE
jgi:hypothetical protein